MALILAFVLAAWESAGLLDRHNIFRDCTSQVIAQKMPIPILVIALLQRLAVLELLRWPVRPRSFSSSAAHRPMRCVIPARCTILLSPLIPCLAYPSLIS